jgi:hypothetical protein
VVDGLGHPHEPASLDKLTAGFIHLVAHSRTERPAKDSHVRRSDANAVGFCSHSAS